MPGSIQVSVLDFKELPSSSNFVKVSLGKVEYEAGGKGDFSFPLMNLRDNLIITIQDADGNLVSRSGVRTMSIIEKGIWDDLFPLEGGGVVQMKLQFILSEEERNRIRSMRESAMKKKQDEILRSRLKNAETANNAFASSLHRHEVSDVLSTAPSQNFQRMVAESGDDVIKEGTSQSQTSPNATDRSEGAPSSPMAEVQVHQKTLVEDIDTRSPLADLMEKNKLVNSEPLTNMAEKSHEKYLVEKTNEESTSIPLLQETKVDLINNSEIRFQNVPKRLQKAPSRSNIAEKINLFSPKLSGEPDKQDPPEKTPRNIRKMISTFESSISQDRGPPLKPLGTKSYRFQSLLKGHVKEDFENSGSGSEMSQKSTPLTSSRLRNSFSTGDLRKPPSNVIKTEEQIGSHNDFVEPIATNTQSKERAKLPYVLSTVASVEVNNEEKELLKSSEEEATVSGRTSEEHEYNSIHKESTKFSSNKIKGDIFGQNVSQNDFDHEKSGSCIFPDEKRHICVTAESDKMMGLFGPCIIEEKSHQEKTVTCIPESIVQGKMRSGIDDSVIQGEEKSSVKSSDDEGSTGQFGQAIKIALVVGFGILVFLFRQREPGKDNKKGKNPPLKTQVFMNKVGSMEEQLKKIDILKLS